jgi:hypothetical protein
MLSYHLYRSHRHCSIVGHVPILCRSRCWCRLQSLPQGVRYYLMIRYYIVHGKDQYTDMAFAGSIHQPRTQQLQQLSLTFSQSTGNLSFAQLSLLVLMKSLHWNSSCYLQQVTNNGTTDPTSPLSIRKLARTRFFKCLASLSRPTIVATALKHSTCFQLH